MTYKILENLKYSDDHDWILVEDNVATIGITDYAQNALGDIVFVELPEKGARINKGEAFGVIESIKSVNDLMAPISGKIIEVNQSVADDPELCNKDPYESWLIKIEMSDSSELSNLMGNLQYQHKCEENEV